MEPMRPRPAAETTAQAHSPGHDQNSLRSPAIRPARKPEHPRTSAGSCAKTTPLARPRTTSPSTRGVTASLPPEVQQVFNSFITTEFTTVDSRGRPICWPLTPYYEQGDPCIDVTTALGYPKKAEDARANPKVSLLFSDPTGSGMDAAPQVLVQGTADVDARDLEATASATPRGLESFRLEGHDSAEAAPALFTSTSPASTSTCVRSACMCGPRRPQARAAASSTRAWRSALSHDEEPPRRTATTAGAPPVWTRAWTSSAGATTNGVLSLVAPERLSLPRAGPDLGRPGGAPDPARW